MTDALTAALDLHQAGELAAAERAYVALIKETGSPDAGHYLALLLEAKGELERAERIMAGACAALPGRADALADHARLLYSVKRFSEAVERAEAAVAAQSSYVPAWTELGNARLKNGDPVGAAQAYGKALSLLPSEQPALVNLGLVQTMLGQFEAAKTSLERALRLWPEDASAHFHYSLLLLTLGNYPLGFQEYAWRKRLPGAARFARHADLPAWTGQETAPDRRVMVTAEQGYGDCLQCLRYLPAMARRGVHLEVRLPRALQALYAAQSETVPVSAPDDPIPDGVAFQVAMMDLPGLLPDVLDGKPYLRPEPGAAARWRNRLAGEGLAIGLVWRGSPDRDLDILRSANLSDLLPLRDLPGVRFFSLQVGEAPDLAIWPDLVDLAPELTDFAESAAAVSALDALVSVDTSMAHLAGALGKRCFTLVEKVPDWRYGHVGSSTPWYESLVLCRQTEIGDWRAAVARASRLISELTR